MFQLQIVTPREIAVVWESNPRSSDYRSDALATLLSRPMYLRQRQITHMSGRHTNVDFAIKNFISFKHFYWLVFSKPT